MYTTVIDRSMMTGKGLGEIDRRRVACGEAVSSATQQWNVQFPWPSGLRRWIKAPISQGAWVRIPPGTHACVRNKKRFFVSLREVSLLRREVKRYGANSASTRAIHAPLHHTDSTA